MAKIAPGETARNERLQKLQDAVDEWAESEKTRLDNEVRFLRAVLSGRKASNLGTKNLDQSSALLQAEINDFLRVGE